MKLAESLRDLAGIAGGGAISYGAWLAWPPAGFVVGGALLIAAAMLHALGAGRPAR